MADKVQLIKEEIERLDEKYRELRVNGTIQQAKETDLVVHVLQQLNNFINSLPEEHNEDLDRLVISLEETIGTSPHSREVIKEHLQKAAERQKQKDEETIELAEEHAILAGMEKMREEMMKDAVEGTVKYEMGSAEIPQCDKRYQVLSDQVYISNAKLGDKVKIVVLKTE